MIGCLLLGDWLIVKRYLVIGRLISRDWLIVVMCIMIGWMYT